ncbi:hypothetical protein [Chitinophaga nivalis]|uniref:DUF5689 domain-containing protein n=1 Tax=Chitinophaga nivalis TaxID=2991709 RepID=A0ABT3IKY1_9BACT|nr:hypothetical protein [Chitinophaga nivalis]MCW3465684.1 hypothetical protein [Chitinophaga nivalis]MCW3484625.1 hypothetical protein [Chitinophaga nivalis]
MSIKTNPGGLPLTQEAYAFLQASYRSAIADLARVSGDKVIISGVIDNGTSVTDGWILHNGELLPFAGGPKQNSYLVVEGNGTEVFDEVKVRTVYNNRYARFGAGGTPFSELVRLDQAANLKQDLINLNNNLSSFSTSLQSQLSVIGQATPPTKDTTVAISGSFWIGDQGGSDGYYTVNLGQYIFSPYLVAGSLRSAGPNWNNDNDVIWSVRDLGTSSFALLLREVSSDVQALYFDYAIIRK